MFKPTRWGLTWRHGVLWLAIAVVLFPVLWILSASVNPSNSLLSARLIPEGATLEHYKTLFTDPNYPFALWTWNSIKISGATAIATVLLCALGAYAFSRFRFRGRRTGLLSFLLVQIFPQNLAVVAIYLLMLQLGEIAPGIGLNTHPGLILVYIGGALGFNTWFMKGYFDTIPRSLEESAMIDGATPFQAFRWIVMPLARPILAVVFILQFIFTYSEFLLALALLKGTEQYTLAVGLSFFINQAMGRRWGPFAAAAIMGALVVLVIFLPLQRQILSGLTRGAVKE